MNSNYSLLSELQGDQQYVKKPITFPAVTGFYRSQIYTADVSINPLIAACDQILSLVTILKDLEPPKNKEMFFQDLAHEIRAFEHQAQILDYNPDIIIAARYALCCLLDETITATKWGQENNWVDENLLALFQNETYGGYKFFTIIDRALENTTANIHLIELLYFCLSLGFVGKYRNVEHGKNELVAITNKLYQIIGQYNYLNCKNLLIDGGDSKDEIMAESEKTKKPPAVFVMRPAKLFKMAIAFAVLVSGLTYFFVSFKLNSVVKQVHSSIEQIKIDNLI